MSLHYAGGAVVPTSQKFVDCVEPGHKATNGMGDKYFYYPVGQRTYTFGNGAGADAPPLTTTTKDQVELTVEGTIAFTLNTNCSDYKDSTGRDWPGGIIQKFNDTIGRKDWGDGSHAYATSAGEDQPKGWDAMLAIYLAKTADRSIDNEALGYTWEQLYNDPASKASWEKAVVAEIPKLVKAQAGEDYFTVNNIVLQKPEIPSALVDQLNARQAATLRAEAAKVDENVARTWPGGITAYLAYQQQLAINKAIADGKVRVIPIPQGSSIQVPVN